MTHVSRVRVCARLRVSRNGESGDTLFGAADTGRVSFHQWCEALCKAETWEVPRL